MMKIIIVFTSAVLVFLFLLAPVANAQWPTDPYGGRSLIAIPCTCTLGCIWVIAGPPRPASLLYCPLSTTLYEYYNIFPSAWQLGNKGWPNTCDMWIGEDCVTVGLGQKMRINGTSLY